MVVCGLFEKKWTWISIRIYRDCVCSMNELRRICSIVDICRIMNFLLFNVNFISHLFIQDSQANAKFKAIINRHTLYE